MQAGHLTARQAADRLGVNLSTLYAYVSRGKLASVVGDDRRSRAYRRDEVERLIAHRDGGRNAAQGAAHSLTWGLPVMPTRISLIRADGHYYRGHAALRLARDGATLEQTATLLWDIGDDDPFAAPIGRAWPSGVASLLALRTLPALERCAAALPLLGLAARHAHNVDPRQRRRTAAALLRHAAAALIAGRPSNTPIHQAMAWHWRPGDTRLPEVLRIALVLCADHELNASAFATRVAASTGAGLHAAVSAGLATLSGPQHGGATARAYSLLEESVHDPVAAIQGRVQRGEALPGFGHLLYPDGDPRAALLLEQLRMLRPRPVRMRHLPELIEAAERHAAQRPSLDLALAAIARQFKLGADAALAIFAAGRAAGWLAHALEQQQSGGLIRPRASYTGTRPAAAIA